MEEARELTALVMGDKGTEISIGKDGFSFKTDGEASQRLANAALDFLSPITEGAGFLGTKLRGYRMEAALKSTVRAKEICDNNGININPVPPKFLLQWVEGASMEDIDDPQNLSELWAQLLASAAKETSANHTIFVDILKKLSRDHIDYLNSMLRGQSVHELVEVPYDYRERWVRENIKGTGLSTFFPDHGISAPELDDVKNLDDLVELVRLRLELFMRVSGVFLTYAFLTQANGRGLHEFDNDSDLMNDSISSALQVQGLIWLIDIPDLQVKSTIVLDIPTLECDFMYEVLSPLGVELLKACSVEK